MPLIYAGKGNIVSDADLRSRCITTDVNDQLEVLGDRDKLSLVAAKLLQLVIDNLPDHEHIHISAVGQSAHAQWCVRFKSSMQSLSWLDKYLQELSDDVEEVIDDLDVALWNILLEQCSAQAQHQYGGDEHCLVIATFSAAVVSVPDSQVPSEIIDWRLPKIVLAATTLLYAISCLFALRSLTAQIGSPLAVLTEKLRRLSAIYLHSTRCHRQEIDGGSHVGH